MFRLQVHSFAAHDLIGVPCHDDRLEARIHHATAHEQLQPMIGSEPHIVNQQIRTVRQLLPFLFVLRNDVDAVARAAQQLNPSAQRVLVVFYDKDIPARPL